MAYVAGRLGLDVEQPDGGYIMSSFGVGELGLHLCFETPATIAVRRAAARDAALARELFGEFAVLPMVLAYNPHRTLMEAVEPDSSGYGRMTISMLDTGLPVPLLRYQTGDVVRLLDSRCVAMRTGAARRDPARSAPGHDAGAGGRDKDMLPGGSHVGVYKDALYSRSCDRRSPDRCVSPDAPGVRHSSSCTCNWCAASRPMRPSRIDFARRWGFRRTPVTSSPRHTRRSRTG